MTKLATACAEHVEELKAVSDSVYWDDNFLVVNDGYEIHKDKLDTPEKIIGWVMHLTGKQWFTSLHLQRFLRLATHGEIRWP